MDHYKDAILTVEQKYKIDVFSVGESAFSVPMKTNIMLREIERMGVAISTSTLSRFLKKVSQDQPQLSSSRMWDAQKIQLLLDNIVEGKLGELKGSPITPHWMTPTAYWFMEHGIKAWDWAKAHMKFAKEHPRSIESMNPGDTVSRMLEWHMIPIDATLLCDRLLVNGFAFISRKDFGKRHRDLYQKNIKF